MMTILLISYLLVGFAFTVYRELYDYLLPESEVGIQDPLFDGPNLLILWPYGLLCVLYEKSIKLAARVIAVWIANLLFPSDVHSCNCGGACGDNCKCQQPQFSPDLNTQIYGDGGIIGEQEDNTPSARS